MAGWQHVMEPMVSPVRALMQRAAAEGWNAKQLLDALPDVLPEMDDAALMESLLRLGFAARASAAAGATP